METTFSALLAPLSNALRNKGIIIDATTGSQKLHFETFVQVFMFGFCIQCPSVRQLVLELATNPSAISLGLPAFSRSTLQDGFTRFRERHVGLLYQYLLMSLDLAKISEIDDPDLKNIGLLKAVDGSIFPLIKSMQWGLFRTKRKALKIHLELCINTLCVTNYIIQPGNSDERKALISMIELGVTYICDRGYFSFALINFIHKEGAFFVLRLKKNYKITKVEVLQLTGTIPACFHHVTDSLVRFDNNPLGADAATFRLVRFRVLKTHFIICTNRLDLTTLQIILLYAYRWQIELFFKYLKRAVNAIHLFSQTQNGAKVYLHLMLCFVLLQLSLKQNCHKIVNNHNKEATGLVCLDISKPREYHIAADWVYEKGLVFKTLFKMSRNWLTYLKNSIAQLFDYQVIHNFATL